MKKILIILGLSFLIFVGCSNPNPTVEKEEVITTHAWFAGDNSYLTFKDDLFIWYLEKEVTDDNFYQGSYTIYHGQEAIDYYVDSFSEIFDAQEAIDTSLAQAKANGLTEDNFIAMILHNQAATVDGEDREFEAYDSIYVGYYIEDEEGITLDFMNLSTGNRALFVSE